VKPRPASRVSAVQQGERYEAASGGGVREERSSVRGSIRKRVRQIRTWAMFARSLAAIVIVAMAFASPSAHAQASFDAQVRNVKSQDARLRSLAALGLGASNDDRAVSHLCGLLPDPSDTVRQAAAIALKRLNRSAALGCLRSRERVESSKSVLLQIKRAIESIEAGGSGGTSAPPTPPTPPPPSAPPPNNPGAKYYVAFGKLNNTTARPAGDVERRVFDGIKGKLAPVAQFAPNGEGRPAAESLIRSRKLTGYQLTVTAEIDGSGGALTIRLKVAVTTYPGGVLKGMFTASGQIPGAQPGDASSEDQLMSAVAENAADQFTKFFAAK
jgi:hypothetical protein